MRDLGFLSVVRVAKWELVKGIRSKRFAVLVAVLMVFPVVAVPVAFYLGQSHDPLDALPFLHIVRNPANTSTPLLVFYVLSAWGVPVANYPVTLVDNQASSERLLRTDSDGRVSASLLPTGDYEVRFEYRQYPYSAHLGSTELAQLPNDYDIRVYPTYDLDFDRRPESQVLRAVEAVGGASATDVGVWLNGTYLGQIDPHGYFRVTVPTGVSEIVLRNATSTLLDLFVGSEPDTRPGALPARQGPGFVYAFLWTTVVKWLIPLLSIALGVEILASEKDAGTIELLCTRPLSKTALGIGKLLGALAMLVLPAILSLIGIAIVGFAAYGTFLSLTTQLGFLGAIVSLGTIFMMMTTLISFGMRGVTNVYIVAISSFILFGPIWGIGLTDRPAGVSPNPFHLATSVFAVTLPQVVARAWPSLSPGPNISDLAISLVLWLAPMAVVSSALWRYLYFPTVGRLRKSPWPEAGRGRRTPR